MARKTWQQFVPFYFYIMISITWIGLAYRSQPRSLNSMLLLFTIGFLSWGLVEYILHRFIFHHQARTARLHAFLYAMHLSHHDDPKALDQLFASLRMSLPIASIYGLIAGLILWQWQAVSYLFAGMILGYFIYEALHYQAHHHTPRLRILRYLKKYHLLHHHQDSHLRYGVTSPIFDYLFGTFRPLDQRLRTQELSRENETFHH